MKYKVEDKVYSSSNREGVIVEYRKNIIYGDIYRILFPDCNKYWWYDSDLKFISWDSSDEGSHCKQKGLYDLERLKTLKDCFEQEETIELYLDDEGEYEED